ncbi:MAG TPA: hypothetical protein GXX36_09670 [Clostridiaceae bacterium]|nr:hypothetical protein [Clostridiaceae bacterium]
MDIYIEAEKVELDGYLADVTDIQDSNVDEIYVWGYVTHHSGFGNEKYIPLLEMKNNNVIRDIKGFSFNIHTYLF